MGVWIVRDSHGEQIARVRRLIMEIGIAKETRRNERRVSLVPRDVAELVKAGHTVHVQEDAGTAAGFPPGAYEQAGARISNGLHDCDLVVGVKEPALAGLKRRLTVMAYLHVEKGQNADLLRRLKKRKILSYAYEEVRNGRDERLINLGFEAGIVGIVEGLRILGKTLENAGRRNPFSRLIPVAEYGSKKRIYSEVAKLGSVNTINVVIMGRGRVSQGVQDLLRQTNISPSVLWRKETANIEAYLPDVDILVNAVDWYPGEPHIVRRRSLRLLKRTALILDISCDTNGAVETCIPTTWDDPVYEVDGITHFCVSNLPSAIPADSSDHLSSMILPHVMKVASGEELKTGLMTKDGQFAYREAHA
ncbi:Alanine dehydrogenase [subsurface metagenome]